MQFYNNAFSRDIKNRDFCHHDIAISFLTSSERLFFVYVEITKVIRFIWNNG